MYTTPYGLRVYGPRARHRRVSWLPWLACILFVVAGQSAFADWTKTDVQVAARALSFVADPLRGTVRVGIVYAPDSPRSVRQAQSLRDMLVDGPRIGGLELRPVLLDAAVVPSANVDLFFLTEFIPPDEAPRLQGEGTQRPILCITTDIAQVRSGNCIMGVRSQPKIEVFVNRATASANNITFSTVFRVMITEL